MAIPDGVPLGAQAPLQASGVRDGVPHEGSHEAPYRLLFDANPQPMWVFSEASKQMLAVNAAAVARYGYSREEFLRLTIMDIRRTLQGQRLTESEIEADPIGDQGLRQTARWQHARKGGELIDVEVTSSDLQWQGQRARLVVVHELTERVALQLQSERSLAEARAARELLDLVISRVSDTVFALDTALRFTYLNAPALRLLHRDSADELMGRPFNEGFDPAHGRVFYSAFVSALASQQPEVFEAFHEPWGKWIEVRAFPSAEGLSIFCSDITERKLFERLLLHREREFRLLAEQMPALIYRTSLEPLQTAMYVSPYIKTLGYSVKDWLADPHAWSNALHPDDNARVLQQRSSAGSDAQAHQVEYRLRNAAGGWHHFRDCFRRIEPDDGSPPYVQGIALDVTDRVESEQALRASEARLRRSEQRYRLAAAGGQVWDWDLVNDRLNLAPDFWAQLGFEPVPAQAYRTRLAALLHPDDLRLHRNAMRRHLKQRKPFGMEVRIRDARGNWRWLQLQGQAQWDDQQRAVFMAGTTNDITARKRVEAALRESEAYRRKLFEQLADGVLLVDHHSRILDANPQALKLLGCPGENLLHRPLQNLLTQHRPPYPADHPPPPLPKPGTLTEWNVMRADGSELSVEMSLRALDATRHIAVLRDMTDRRAAQHALLKHQIELSELNQRLMQQERTTTQRLAQALHDHLGQSLAVARLNLDTLLVTTGAAMPQTMLEQCQRLAKVLAQAVVDVREVLADLRPPLLQEQGLAAALDNETRVLPLATDTDVLLEVAEGLHRQRWPSDVEYTAFMVAREAIANARLHARASLIRVLLEGGEERLHLDVVDDGAGIAPELRQGRPGHLGIVGMRERAISIGARFTIVAEAGGGTRVCLNWAAGGA